MNTGLLVTEIILLILLIISLALEILYPCNKVIRILLVVIVAVKIMIISRLARSRGFSKGESVGLKRGEEKELAKCRAEKH